LEIFLRSSTGLEIINRAVNTVTDNCKMSQILNHSFDLDATDLRVLAKLQESRRMLERCFPR